MATTHEGGSIQISISEEERQQIRSQLNRLLETHHFKNSKRYPALLRFIVEETLEGRGEYLKERLLGMRVFDRPADYDTATDPIVRVTIAEIRKRIAQYYHDEEHDAEMRIELLPGRYAPEFRSRTAKRESSDDHQIHSQSINFEQIPPSKPHEGKYLHKGRWPLGLLAVLLFGVAMVFWEHFVPSSALDDLWAPLLGSQQQILFCIPTDVGKKREQIGDSGLTGETPGGRFGGGTKSDGASFLAHESLGENIVYSDMLATLKIANVLAAHHHDYRVRLNVLTTLEDLREGPTVLIGGMDNQWTMRSLAPLRFHFAGSDQEQYWIVDTQNPKARDWSLDLNKQYIAVTNDYAIIARLHNQQTGQVDMIVAGIGMSGTAAAGGFIADRSRVQELSKRIGPGFKNHDFEAVLSTDVVNGIAGSPKIVAVSVW